MDEPPSLPTVAYADALGRHGIVVSHDGTTLTVTMPQRFGRTKLATMVVALLFLISYVGRPTMLLARSEWAALLPVLLFGLAAIPIGLRYRGRHPMTIIVTPDDVRVHGALPAGDSRELITRVRPRLDVYRVYYVDRGKALFFRTHGREMVEMPLPYGTATGNELARILCQELNLPTEPRLPDRSATVH